MEHFKRSTARDFRINGATLEAALREESSDGEEDDELNADEQDEVSLNQRILATIITRREERWVELPFPKTSGTGEKLANRSADLRVSSNDHRSPYRFSSGRVCELCLAEWFGRWVITLLPQIVSLESEHWRWASIWTYVFVNSDLMLLSLLQTDRHFISAGSFFNFSVIKLNYHLLGEAWYKL